MNKELVIENFKNPKNWGKIEGVDPTKVLNASCGDEITIYIKVTKGVIEDIKYEAVGCSICVASASILSEKLIGRKVSSVLKLEEDYPLELIEMEKESPRKLCAVLSMQAVKKGLQKKD